MRKEQLHTTIAVGVAVTVFLAIFGGVFFPIPKPTVLEIFSASVLETQKNLINSNNNSATVKDQRTLEATLLLNGLVEIADLKTGNGLEATDGKEIRVGYVGTYVDEKSGKEVEFDKNTDPESGFTFVLGSGQVIPGFDAGIAGMREGGIRLIVIDPRAGYGSQQTGRIPPNTTLRFIVELYEVH